MEGGKEPNYWPGFVDALSNVVLTLVFVLIVFVFALVMASNKVEKKVQELTEQKNQDSKKSSEVTTLQTQNEALAKQLEAALSDLKKARAAQGQVDATQDKGDQTIAKFKKSDDSQESKLDPKSDDMVITFNPNAISLTDNTTKVLNGFLDKFRDKDGKLSDKVTIESSFDPNNPVSSQAKEAELGRDLNIRNVLLDGKVGADKIAVKSVEPNQQEGTYNWVRIHVEK